MAWSTVQVDLWSCDVSKSNELLDTTEAAKFLGVARVTLRQWRWRRCPWQPPFVRCGTRSIRYRRQSLEQWALERESLNRGSGKDRGPGGRQARRARGV